MILMRSVKHFQTFQNSKLKPLQYLKKEVRDEVDFVQADKHKSFLQVDFNTLVIGHQSFLQCDIIIINRHNQAFSKYSK